MTPIDTKAAIKSPDIAKANGVMDVRMRNRIAETAPKFDPKARHCDFE